jgi:hypothetical protein
MPGAQKLMARAFVLAVALGTVVVAACGRITREVRLVSDPRATVGELWQEPSDLERRDLYCGAGGKAQFPGDAAFTLVARGFVVRDVGASLGRTTYPTLLKWFRLREVLETVTLSDVRWTCTLLSRLSDTQWREAFRAGGYNAEHTSRYVAKIKARVAQGLQVSAI